MSIINNNVNDDQFQNDEFFNFLNYIFFYSNSLDINPEEEDTLKYYHSKLKHSNENSLNKLQIFYDNILMLKLDSKNTNIIEKKK